MRIRPLFKRLFYLAVFSGLFAVTLLYMCDRVVKNSTSGRMYTNVAQIPHRHAGMVLGTSKFLRDGLTVNPYYKYRIEAAFELIRANKISYLVISGDNSRKTYSEPEDMRNDLIAMGIDSNRIFLDYAGFRTFDSVIRLREIFSQTEYTVISQKFHNERAIFIAGTEGMDAIGFNARDVGKRFGFMVNLREKFARVKLFIDHIAGAKPHFLGPKVHIPAK